MIIGNFDDFDTRGYITGWVHDTVNKNRREIPIVGYKDDVAISQSVANILRGDGYLGFRLNITGENITKLILDERLSVFAEGEDSSLVKLSIHTPMLQKARTALEEENKIKKRKIELTPIMVSVGHQSLDGSIIAGREGYLFLYKGSNEVASLYKEPPDFSEIERLAQRWFEIFTKRQRILQENGASYIQIIVPEKSTVLNDQAPSGLGPITPLLKKIEDLIYIKHIKQENAVNAPVYYTSYIDVLRHEKFSEPKAFLRTDSHLSDLGSRAVFCEILSQIASQLPLHSSKINELLEMCVSLGMSDEEKILCGDIAERFFGVPIYEKYASLDIKKIDRFQSGTPKVIKNPEKGGHIGLQLVWQNPNAPIPLKVVAFANSFFERGESPRGLSWWCKNAFKEFHFLWNPDIDEEYIKLHKPDLVICQTIERFLRIVPAL